MIAAFIYLQITSIYFCSKCIFVLKNNNRYSYSHYNYYQFQNYFVVVYESFEILLVFHIIFTILIVPGTRTDV